MAITIERAKNWYADTDAVHGFGHIRRVYRLCEQIGPLENADMEILLSAALLHDAQGGHPGEGKRKDHHIHSAHFAKTVLEQDNWQAERIAAVQHCIRAHRFRNQELPQTIEAKVLFDADKIDVIGAVGVVRALAYAFQAEQPFFEKPSAGFLANGEKLPGEPHSAYHEYHFKLKHISGLLFTQTAREIAGQRQIFLNTFFAQLAQEMDI